MIRGLCLLHAEPGCCWADAALPWSFQGLEQGWSPLMAEDSRTVPNCTGPALSTALMQQTLRNWACGCNVDALPATPASGPTKLWRSDASLP